MSLVLRMHFAKVKADRESQSKRKKHKRHRFDICTVMGTKITSICIPLKHDISCECGKKKPVTKRGEIG